MADHHPLSPHRREPTRNRMGWTSNTLNELSELFVESCGPGQLVLDIGCAHGVAALAAAARGARVLANDVDLRELQARVGATEGLNMLPGRFPQDLQLAPASLDAVHASSVLHFLTGRQLEIGAAKVARWLKPGGLLWVHAATPWLGPFAPFREEFARRQASGEPWPGWIENTRLFSQHRLLAQLPKSLHLLEDKTLQRVFEAAGLITERAWLFRRRDLPKSLYGDGRESVGYIARKT